VVGSTIQPAAEKSAAPPAGKGRPPRKNRNIFSSLLEGLLSGAPVKTADALSGKDRSSPGSGASVREARALPGSAPAESGKKSPGAGKAGEKGGRTGSPGGPAGSTGGGEGQPESADDGAVSGAARGAGKAGSAAGARVGALSPTGTASGAAVSAEKGPGIGGAARPGQEKDPEAGGGDLRRSRTEIRHARRPAEARERRRAPETEAREEKDKPVKVEPGETGPEPRREIIELKAGPRFGSERLSGGEVRPGSDGDLRDGTAGLFHRLREEGNERIVRGARILLRDREEGEIRLILKPERLGEVRIRLRMKDNLIGGRIIVENESVRESFQRNLPELAEAFRNSGFDVGDLDVSVGGGTGRERGDGPAQGGSGARRIAAGTSWADASGYYGAHAVNYVM